MLNTTLNPDGVSVRGCKFIYAPKGQAGEYSPLAANPYRGCGHGCAYCYVPAVLHMDRKEFDAGAIPRPDFADKLLADAITLRMIALLNQLGAAHYIKRDLQSYLPAGYPNPLRVPQHH